MSFSKFYDYWYKHGECCFFISLQNGKEIIIFKETHGSISNLLLINYKNSDQNYLQVAS